MTRKLISQMKPGAVAVDVAVDQGGCFETTHATTHSDPVYTVDGVIHYCVANMPGAVARTSTFALTNSTLRYALQLANKGLKKAVADDAHLAEGVNTYAGKLTYKAVTFAALLTTLASGQADIVISDIYATEERAKAADFITYSKVFDGVLVAKGNPKGINGINMSMCGTAAAENTGYVEVPLIQALIPECKKAGKPEPTIQLYDNNANCIQAILAGRADTYVNDVNTVDNAVKANPDKLEKAVAVTIPYSVGIAVPKDKPKFREAVMAALVEIYKSGDQLALLKKWELDPANLKEPGLLTVN